MARYYTNRRSGDLGANEKSFEHVGTEFSEVNDFSIQLISAKSTKAPSPIPTTPALWVARLRPSSPEEIKERQ